MDNLLEALYMFHLTSLNPCQKADIYFVINVSSKQTYNT